MTTLEILVSAGVIAGMFVVALIADYYERKVEFARWLLNRERDL